MNDPTPHLERFETYQQACSEFQWSIPQCFNIASAICRRHADDVTRIALNEVKHAGINTYTFGGLDFLSDKFAMALSESGINRGDAVAVLLPQSASLAVAHLGALKTGAVVVPLSMSSDPRSSEYALADCRAKALVVDESIYGRVETLARSLPNLESRFVVRDLRPAVTSSDIKDFWSEVDCASSDFETVETDASSIAFIFYIESQGRPTGVVHTHRSVIGQLSAFEMFNNLDREAESVFWTADDWSSASAVLGVLYPAWWHGYSLVASSEDPAGALHLMERCEVTHAFIPSSQLKVIAASQPQLRERFDLKLRTVVCDGPLSPELGKWAKSKLNVTPNEVYGKPETGWMLGGCERWFPTRAGFVGRAVPGHLIEILDDSGSVLPSGKTGRIAAAKSNPSLFSEFHNAPEKTASSFGGDWFVTGDLGYKSEDGDFCVCHPQDEDDNG